MNVTGIVFTNDASLGELTTKRTMASLPFGGRYRQVDWALSNLACAGVRHIGIISRHNFQSLMNHIGDGKTGGYIGLDKQAHFDIYNLAAGSCVPET